MTILHLSDTHGMHKQIQDLPDADVIVHSGDFTMAGSEDEVFDFLNWFLDLPYKHKIFIAGNHDDCLAGADISGLDSGAVYLCNSGVDIDGVRFYGMPMFMSDCMDGSQERNIDSIPSDADVLVTHQPPLGILDMDQNIRYGSVSLLQKVSDTPPRLHLFGHIHQAHGIKSAPTTIFSNASIVDSAYNLTFSPNLFTLQPRK